jgi:hypothetical protein
MRLSYYTYSLSQGVRKIKTRTAVALSIVSLAFGGGSGLALVLSHAASAVTPTWNVNGAYTFDFELSGSHYVHAATIAGEDSSGNFTVNGGYPAGGPYAYAWAGAGNVTGNSVTFSVDYSVGAPGTHMDMTGSIAPNGSLSGSWTDNFGGTRTGTWTSKTGIARMTSNVVVTPANTQGWSTADTRPGGAVNFVADSTAPGDPHVGALQLTTDATTTSKAQYLHATNTSLADVTELSYATKQVSGPAFADPSSQLITCLGGIVAGNCVGFTTFVFEPYENGVVTPGSWQNWNVAAGQSWSSRSYTDGGTCLVVAGGGGAPFYTLAALKTACPNAVVEGFGVNIGSNNPSYNVETDSYDFNGTVYNFEPFVVVTDKDACKDDGWKTQKAADGSSFKNQGACVSYVASNGKSQH